MKTKMIERARAVFVRVAFVVALCASTIGQHAAPAVAVVPVQDAADEITAPAQNEPIEVWAVTWTLRLKTSWPYESWEYKDSIDNDVSHTTSFQYRVFRDGSTDNANMKVETFDNKEWSASDRCVFGNRNIIWNKHDRMWVTGPTIDESGSAPKWEFVRYVRDGARLGRLDANFTWWQFTIHQHGVINNCNGGTEESNKTEMKEWLPGCVDIAELIPNEEGTQYSYHVEDTTIHISCVGPTYGRGRTIVGSTSIKWSLDIDVRLVGADDLIVDHLEVTQGLQDLANSMPLAQGRRTIVRAYIGTGLDFGIAGGVDAKLEAFAGGAKLGELRATNLSGSITTAGKPDWRKIDDTLNFALPNSWTRRGPLKLKVTVNPDRRQTEMNYTNNDLSVTVDFGVCKEIYMGYVKVGVGGEDGVFLWPVDAISRGRVFAHVALPIPDQGFLYYPWGKLQWPHSLETVEGVTRLLNTLATMRHLGSGSTPEYIVGWTMQLNLALHAGRAHKGGREAWVSHHTSPDHWRVIFAHELTHNFGRDHTSETTAGMHWFDVYNWEIKPAVTGEVLKDFMFAKVPEEREAWSSPQTYRFVYDTLCGGGSSSAGAEATAAQTTAADALLVSADVFSSTTAITGTLAPLLDLANAPVDPPLPGGDYCIYLKDADDWILDARCFEANAPDDLSEIVASTTMVITRPVGLERVELYDVANDSVLAARVASTNTPTVTVDDVAAAGAVLNGATTIHWTGGDPDGDPLTYYLLYSRDDGATWRGVDAYVTEQSATIDFDSQPGTEGATGRIKVMVTDGFHTAEDVTDLPFAVDGKAPTAAIDAPASGGTFSGRSFVALYGAGMDLEDGAMEGSTLAWASDKDGALGTGRVLEANLSPGAHTITLTVTDSEGQQDTATIQLTVTTPPAEQETLDVYLPRVDK